MLPYSPMRPPTRAFPPTRPSAIEAACSEDPTLRERGLQSIAAAYWRPVYSYLRLRWRKPHDDAADFTQSFFAELLEKDLLGRFDPSQARLRTWLRICIDGAVANHARAASRRERGGLLASADFAEAEAAIDLSAASSPELAFEKEWARAVFSIALERLRERCSLEGKAQHFVLLEAYDLGERPSYECLAHRFGIAITEVTNRLAWARRGLRESVLEVLGELTSSNEELREEVRALFEPA